MKTATRHIEPSLKVPFETAADLMSPNPVSIATEALVREAIGLLVDKNFSAAPVIDEAGRPVGVVSRSDILVHERWRNNYVPTAEQFSAISGFSIVDIDRTRVGDIMTPAVFSVRPETSSNEVVEQMLSLQIHQVFVVDEKGTLVGVISTHDVLRHMHRGSKHR